MRRVTLLSSLPLLRYKTHQRPEWSPISPLDKSSVEHLEEEAAERGFMRRDTPNSKVYMEESFSKPERISSGVLVANLPPVEREKTEFDVYQRSTRDYTSQVTPFSTTGVGLGAGFGVREDKRLSFIRPRKLQPFAGDSSIIPKYDENGMPIEESLTREQLLKKRLAYMKSFEGTTMSHREHFLLVDLDFEKDAMIFGTTRAEFERNVTRLKQVVSEYSRWERTDNFYHYGTIILKILTVWLLMECVQQFYELRLLVEHYDDFVEAMEETLNSLEENLQKDLKRAREELVSHPPDFSSVLEAMRCEKRRLLKESAGAAGKGSEVRDTGAGINRSEGAVLSSVIAEITAAPSQRGTGRGAIGGVGADLVVGSATNEPKPHPMDTTHEEKYLSLLGRREAQREMRRLHEHTTNSTSPLGLVSTLWHRIGGGGGGDTVTPLQQEDFSRLSYAASPTSIETLRAVRRILLPRSEDYTQTVREEMVEYKRQKEATYLHPD
ncbi:hypothetical protein ERJ75_000533900 [Trypanosoma vivax]|uniref:Uncharacterized protein n=1 Tax=Trypanosoma vivax (strain Y486) TaxID=1055687 RepID=G0TS65_TRYVY|nr:hypothetical protein TRVL_04079 [Trypanosoma vivax]KAH8615928.1 hypothetical protein ERJ75_000533900 [Trypanosoma vivax]CCC46790.1 conserved hypothetical protein [Trypanosoma vivax Y486]